MREKVKTETTGKAAAAAWWSFCVTAMQLSPASDKNKKGGVKIVLMCCSYFLLREIGMILKGFLACIKDKKNDKTEPVWFTFSIQKEKQI